MNFQLAKEIYGITPWLMDAHSVPLMTSILNDIKNGVKLEAPEVKLNTPYIINISSAETRLISRPWQLNSQAEFDAIGLINIDGPITKNGGTSSLGMSQLSSMMISMSRDSRVKSFIVLTDSGGGSSSAVQIMVDTINEVKQSKPVIGLVAKGGAAASAAYGIISSCDEIYCEDGMAIVGSIGTMVQFEGKAANSTNADGVKHIRLYATKSTKKNEAFEEALNKDNYKLIVNELLNPINENFINMVSGNRPKINQADFDDGRTYFAKDVIGTYVDGIKSMADVISLAIQSAAKKETQKSKINNNLIQNQMTKAEFKAANPSVYQEIVAEGITQEVERTGAWMAHIDTDSKAVAEGIKNGEAITPSQREHFFVKQNAKGKINTIQSDSADDIQVDESAMSVEEIAQAESKKELDAAFGWNLK